jgi:hypothetical protein
MSSGSKISSKKNRAVKNACNCRLNCIENIKPPQRLLINTNYWSKTRNERQFFLRSSVAKVANGKKRSTTKCLLNDENNQPRKVCRAFFLKTLGMSPANDSIIRNSLKCQNPEKENSRGRHNRFPFPKTHINDHISQYKPEQHHYRREHAPNTKYLSSENNVIKMHANYLLKNPEKKNSYTTYRRVVRAEKISFAKLGHEQCERCQRFFMHDKLHVQQLTENNFAIKDYLCTVCIGMVQHKCLYKIARELYQADSEDDKWNDFQICVAVDLEKVIMLPKLDQFKEVSIVFKNTIFLRLRRS